VIVTTAAIPGRPSPKIVTSAMVQGMEPGSVIVDLASERGGNCELTKPGGTGVTHGGAIIGAVDLPATMPYHASQMYATNLVNLLKELVTDGQFAMDPENEILEGTLVCHGGEVVHERVRDLMGLPPLPKPEAPEPESSAAADTDSQGGAS